MSTHKISPEVFLPVDSYEAIIWPMSGTILPDDLNGYAVHLIGVKGTGMCALAEFLTAAGAEVAGSDVEEEFYTDAILAELGVPVVSFKKGVLSPETRLCVRSAAYDESNPVVSEAIERGLPIATYPEVLGDLSKRCDSSAVAGVHGKTTTTALAGTLLRSLNLPAKVIVGSAVSGFGGRSFWSGGDDYLVAETCEYRRHFLNFRPRRIVLTSVESDHQDFYPDYNSIRDAFIDFVLSLPEGGELIYCSDDKGACEVAEFVEGKRSDIRFIPYGESASGPWKVTYEPPKAGRNGFGVDGYDGIFELAVPGKHIALDAAAALALAESIRIDFEGRQIEANAGDADRMGFSSEAAGGAIEKKFEDDADYNDVNRKKRFQLIVEAFVGFRGSRRRSEIIGDAGGVLVMDDYAHHPTAVSATLAGLKAFHPDRRLIVDFMPHTYSRTAALLDDFISCFDDADILVLHPIYASAREAYGGGITGKDLFESTKKTQGGENDRVLRNTG